MGACVLLWGFGDRSWLATPLLFGSRWLLLLPLLVLVPAAGLRRRRLVLPLALAAAIVVGPIMGGELGWKRALPVPPGMAVRVMTYNVGGDDDGGGRVARELAPMLYEWKPDVVAFQECGYLLADAIRRSPGWSHDVRDELCLMSRHPITEVAVMDRTALRSAWRSETGGTGAGYVIRYTLATPAGPISVTNVHLETPREGVDGVWSRARRQIQRNIALRELESAAARRWANDGTRRLVAGDFNMPVESRIFRDHWADLTDSFSEAGVGFGATRYAGLIRARIDHVLADESWSVRASRVVDILSLDHGAVVADLVLTGG